jgi:hypothetical protein
MRLIISQQYASAQLLVDVGADPRFGRGGIERFWRAFEHQRSQNLSDEGRRELERLQQTVLQRLDEDP